MNLDKQIGWQLNDQLCEELYWAFIDNFELEWELYNQLRGQIDRQLCDLICWQINCQIEKESQKMI